MNYYKGFMFKLDENNIKWKTYFDSLKKENVGVYSVAKYFYQNLNSVLLTIYKDSPIRFDLNSFSEESLLLCETQIEKRKETYTNLLQVGDSCVIAISGYRYIGIKQSAYSFYTEIAKKEIPFSCDINYPQLIEDLFVLRFGKKPQDMTADNVEYFIPSPMIAVSANASKLARTENILHISSIPEIEAMKRQCFCYRDITVDEMTSLIYELRAKENYISFKEALFCNGDTCDVLKIDRTGMLQGSPQVALFTQEINRMFKTYNIFSCKRKIHMIAQCYYESNRFLNLSEIGEGKDSYGGGKFFKGRGLIQLTHDYTYLAYYDYKNNTIYYEKYKARTNVSQTLLQFIEENKIENFDNNFYNTRLIPFAKSVVTDISKVIDSAGWFVMKFKTLVLEEMDKGIDDVQVQAVTKKINGGTNGLIERKNYTRWIKEFWKYEELCNNK